MSIPFNLVPLGVSCALPPGYTPLEFLQSSGEQHIDTGLSLSNEHVVTADLQMVAAGAVSGACFGSQDEGNKTNFAFSLYELPSTYFYGWYFYGTTSVDVKNEEVGDIDRYSRLRVQIKDRWLSINGKAVKRGNAGTFNAVRTCWLFDRNSDKDPAAFIGRFFSFVVDKGSTLMRLIPALTPAGEPCMLDSVSSKPFTNDGPGQFIAGVSSVAQLATLLRNLPATGGELTLSLPAEANTLEVADMLQACHDTKGWTITVHEYRPAAAATYSLRRVREVVWCSPSPCEHGSYVDNFGTRWKIDRCAAIFGPHGQDPSAYGYTPFDSPEQAAEEWGLTPYIAPDEVQT